MVETIIRRPLKHMSRFDPQLVHVELEVYKVVMGEFSLRVLSYSYQSFHQNSIRIY